MLTENKCVVKGCECNAVSNGGRWGNSEDENLLYCRRHLSWFKKYGTTNMPRRAQGTVEERFWRFVDKSDGCWSWNGTKLKKGYGVFTDAAPSPNVRGKTISAHRYSYQLHYGDLQEGDYVLHSCDNPQCTNPLHLRKGTQSENIKEAYDKGRKKPNKKFGEASGKSKLTEEQVRFIKSHPELGHKAIADMYGLSPNCIRGVRIGRTWTHIE